MTKDIQAEGALKAWGFLIVLALIWGSSFILIKKSLIAIQPSHMGAMRIAISFVAFIPFLIYNRQKIEIKRWKVSL